MPKSPFPKYDPERANVAYERNFHITVMLVFISILYFFATLGCIIKLSLPGYALKNLSRYFGEEPKSWATWINLWLFILTIPTLMIFALKRDYLFGLWAPLKGLPLMLTALIELIVVGVQGMEWNVDWMDGIMLIVIPLTIYFLCIVMGRTDTGRKWFVPFQEKGKQDLEWRKEVSKPEIKVQSPTPPVTESTNK